MFPQLLKSWADSVYVQIVLPFRTMIEQKVVIIAA
jgi:hypothetical protein